MNDILQTIEEIITKQRDFKINAEGGSYYLKETNEPTYPQTTIKQKGKMLIYSFDVNNSNDDVFPLFNKNKAGVTSLSDYIIFYPKNDVLYTFICEQKTGTASAKVQVEASWLLAEYIVKTACRMMNFKEISIEYRALVFSLSKTSQFSTSLRKEPYIILQNSHLKNKLLRAGEVCFLDNLCF